MERRSEETTQFISRSQEWFKGEFYDPIQRIRTNDEWKNQAGWLSESTQGRLDMYNPLVMSKPFLLHDAKIMDKFGSSHLFWLDARYEQIQYILDTLTHDRVLDKLSKIDKMTFIAFPL